MIWSLVVLTLGSFSGFAASLALSVLMWPIITRATEEVLRLVDEELREGALALGLPRWKVILRIVIPTASAGIFTAVMLAVARGLGFYRDERVGGAGDANGGGRRRRAGVALLSILQDSSTFRVESDPVAGTTPPATQPFGVTTTTSPFISITPTQNSSSSAEPVNQGSNGGALWLGRLLSTIGILALFGGLALIAIGWPEGPEYVVTVRYLRAVWILALVGTVLYLIAYAAKYHDILVRGGDQPERLARPQGRRLARPRGAAAAGFRARRGLGGDAAGADHRPGDGDVGVGDPGRRADRASPSAVSTGRCHGSASASASCTCSGAAVWFGGVAIVARVVLAGPGEEDLLHATRAFSRMSTKAMVLVIVTGVAQTIRLDGNPFSSSHGQVVLLKAVAVAAMIAVGLEARRQVGYRLDRAHEMTVGLADRFRRGVRRRDRDRRGGAGDSAGGCCRSSRPRSTSSRTRTYTREIAFVDPSTGIDARVLHRPGGGRPQRVPDRGQRAPRKGSPVWRCGSTRRSTAGRT